MAYGLGNMAGGYAQGLEQTRARKDMLRQQAFANTMAQQGMQLDRDRLQLERANAMNNLKLGFLDHQEAVRSHQALEAQARAEATQRGEEFQKTHDLALKEFTTNQAKNFALIRQSNASILTAALAEDRATSESAMKYALDLIEKRIKETEAEMAEAKKDEYLDPDAKAARKRMDTLALQLAEAQGSKAMMEKAINDGLAAGYTPQMIADEYMRRRGEAELPGAQAKQATALAARYEVETKEFPKTAQSERDAQAAQADYQRALTSKVKTLQEMGDPESMATAQWMMANPDDPLTMSIVNAGALGGKTGAAKMMPNIPQLEEQERKAYGALYDAAKEEGVAISQDEKTGKWLILATDPTNPSAKTQDWFPLVDYLPATAKTGKLGSLRAAYNSYMTIVASIVHAQNVMAGIPAEQPAKPGTLTEDAAAIERARKAAPAGFPSPTTGPGGALDVAPPRPAGGLSRAAAGRLIIGDEVWYGQRGSPDLKMYRIHRIEDREGQRHFRLDPYTSQGYGKTDVGSMPVISGYQLNMDPLWEHRLKRRAKSAPRLVPPVSPEAANGGR